MKAFLFWRVMPSAQSLIVGKRVVVSITLSNWFGAAIWCHRIIADAYQGLKTVAAIAKTGTWKLAIAKRDELHCFIVLPKRWVVERTLAWINRNRRLARDFERYAQSAVAFIRLAIIRLTLRCLTRPILCS